MSDQQGPGADNWKGVWGCPVCGYLGDLGGHRDHPDEDFQDVMPVAECVRLLAEKDEKRAFILLRKDDPGDHEGYPVAVYVGDPEACKADMEHRQSVNPDCLYYVLEKPLNPKSRAALDELGGTE